MTTAKPVQGVKKEKKEMTGWLAGERQWHREIRREVVECNLNYIYYQDEEQIK
jgi:hypothetical protein